MFSAIDADGNGMISRSEIGAVLRSLGTDPKDFKVDEVNERIGGSNGCITLQQFISFNEESTYSTSSSSVSGADESCDPDLEVLKSAFDVSDVDKVGFISAKELQRVTQTLGGKHASLDECRHMISCVDKDGNQMVDFSEFRCFMSGASALPLKSKRRKFAGF